MEFRKIDSFNPLVMCQRTYIPSVKKIGLNFEILEIREGSPPLGGEWREFQKKIKRHSLNNGVQSIHTKFQGNRTIFRDEGFGGVSPHRGERELISENGQNSSSINVPETISTKFQDNRTKFRDFGPPLGGGGMGGNIGKLKKTYVK